jgi:hypothetical protein
LKWWRIIQPGHQAKKRRKMSTDTRGYFQRTEYVSNSDLTKLQQELGGRDAVDTSTAFSFGTLVHAMILEPHKVDLIQRTVEGVDHQYTFDQVYAARKMRDAFKSDSFCRSLLSACSVEVEMYHPGTRFTHESIDFTLDTRRKYDLWNPATNWGGDVKSTTATTQAQFETAVNAFDYDRARVFYAAGPGAIQDVIIGVSKVAPYRVFKVFMKAGDPLWQSGERKVSALCYKWWALKSQEVGA